MWLKDVDWWPRKYTVSINWKMVLIVGLVWAVMFIFL